jgi:hypothetical protein
MKLGLHTYSLNLHGIGQAWAGFNWPWPRQKLSLIARTTYKDKVHFLAE